jgi:hypothetical protein
VGVDVAVDELRYVVVGRAGDVLVCYRYED